MENGPIGLAYSKQRSFAIQRTPSLTKPFGEIESDFPNTIQSAQNVKPMHFTPL
ncbi:hypothetical protein [Maribacter sp. 2-571]|uniref:hypothetical protein n=1 Tax=Maribacter sp. 2-571 TaxID=3417569 RepID=UPI003D3253C1